MPRMGRVEQRRQLVAQHVHLLVASEAGCPRRSPRAGRRPTARRSGHIAATRRASRDAEHGGDGLVVERQVFHRALSPYRGVGGDQGRFAWVGVQSRSCCCRFSRSTDASPPRGRTCGVTRSTRCLPFFGSRPMPPITRVFPFQDANRGLGCECLHVRSAHRLALSRNRKGHPLLAAPTGNPRC